MMAKPAKLQSLSEMPTNSSNTPTAMIELTFQSLEESVLPVALQARRDTIPVGSLVQRELERLRLAIFAVRSD
jgi:hypothetical protein